MPNSGDFRKLNGVNYAEWAMMMEAWLVKKGIWEVVNGDETKPMGSLSSKAVKSFSRRQAEARAEIILHVDESQLAYVRDPDPHVTWDTLKLTYRACGFVTRRVLRRKFFGLVKQEDQLMPAQIAVMESYAL